MKRFIIIISVLLCAVSVSAQDGKEIYNRYAGKEGVSAVYISPAMFSLIKSIPDIRIESEDVNLGEIIRTFEGMYILDVEDKELAAGLSEDIRRRVSQGKYELLMEVVDGQEKVHIYIVRKGETVTDFMMLSDEGASVSVISITGNMPMAELQKIMAAAAS